MRFGHRLDPWRGDKGDLERRMVGLVGEEGGAFSKMGRMAWFEKNDSGRGNWCGIKGKRIERWKHGVLRHVKRIRAEAAGDLERNSWHKKAMLVLWRPDRVWSAWIWRGHKCDACAQVWDQSVIRVVSVNNANPRTATGLEVRGQGSGEAKKSQP